VHLSKISFLRQNRVRSISGNTRVEVEIWGVGQRRGYLRKVVLRVESLASPNATNSKAAWSLYERFSVSRFKLSDILSCQAEVRRFISQPFWSSVAQISWCRKSLFTKGFKSAAAAEYFWRWRDTRSTNRKL